MSSCTLNPNTRLLLIPAEAQTGEYEEGEVRLVDGLSATEGRVEIYHLNRWGTVCDDYWQLADADVVCKQLGFLSGLKAVPGGSYGPGSGPIHMDDVACTGAEQQLADCDFPGWENSNCGHDEDAGVMCRPGEKFISQTCKFGLVDLLAEVNITAFTGYVTSCAFSCQFAVYHTYPTYSIA